MAGQAAACLGRIRSPSLPRSLAPSFPLRRRQKHSEEERGRSGRQPGADTGRATVEIATAAAARGIWHCYYIAGPISQCSPPRHSRGEVRSNGPKRSPKGTRPNIHACGCSKLINRRHFLFSHVNARSGWKLPVPEFWRSCTHLLQACGPGYG